MTLIDRLSKLGGPDREVDALVWCEVNGVVYLDHYPLMHETQVIFKEKGKRKEKVSGDNISHAAFYTASVDAAIALAERVLPGYDLTIRTKHKMAWIDGHKGQIAYGANSAIAACIAILRAKEASNG